MSALARYLAPTRDARPNPGHVVEWRHAEAGPWYPLDPSATRGVSLRQTEDLLASPPVALVQGDLARVLDPKGQVAGFSVMTDKGLIALPSGGARSLSGSTFKTGVMFEQAMKDWHKASGYDWEKAWDGSVRADWMLYLAGRLNIDRRLLVLAACACVETVLHYLPAREQRPRVAIEAARSWARGEVTLGEAEAASTASGSIAPGQERAFVWASTAAAGIIRLATEDRRDVAGRAHKVSRDVLYVLAARIPAGPDLRNAWDLALASMAVLVRREIPLWRLALALADRVTATPW